MSDVQPPPWWYSDEGSDKDSDRPPQPAPEENWLALLGSLGSLASQWWAASQTGNDDRTENPVDFLDQIVSRAQSSLSVVLTDPEVHELPAVRWLPVRRL